MIDHDGAIAFLSKTKIYKFNCYSNENLASAYFYFLVVGWLTDWLRVSHEFSVKVCVAMPERLTQIILKVLTHFWTTCLNML